MNKIRFRLFESRIASCVLSRRGFKYSRTSFTLGLKVSKDFCRLGLVNVGQEVKMYAQCMQIKCLILQLFSFQIIWKDLKRQTATMAIVHYKFKNSVEHDSLKFDGLAISLRDLKQGILHKKKMKAEDTDLQVVNAQTGEGKFKNIYKLLNMAILKNCFCCYRTSCYEMLAKSKRKMFQNKRVDMRLIN